MYGSGFPAPPSRWVPLGSGFGITQLPDCQTIHLVSERANESVPYTLLHEFNGFKVDQQVPRHVASAPKQLRFIRVETTSAARESRGARSRSIAWRLVAIRERAPVAL